MIKNIILGVNIEEEMKKILNEIHIKGPISPIDFENLAYIKKFHENIFAKYEKKLLYLMGLFYKTTPPESVVEKIYSLYSSIIEEEMRKKFTPVQADALRKIHRKKFFSYSAPTSAGKSFLFRELIEKFTGDIVIVVPSRALIAEYMLAVTEIVDKRVLVLQFIENINTEKVNRRIFIITPERGVELFKKIGDFNIQLFLLDEAQISEEKIRGMTFDSFVRRIERMIPNAKKVFAHPFVDNPNAQLEKHNFNQDAAAAIYNQNSIGKIYLSYNHKSQKLFYFSPYDPSVKKIEAKEDIVEKVLKNSGTLLVYTSKEKIYDGRYITDFAKYIDLCPKLTDKKALGFIEKLRNFIGSTEKKGSEKFSLMINMMEKGIVIHHGSMPLKARLIVEGFVKENHACICFATSTLIQGINMPFDVVWIDNFSFRGAPTMKALNLKNLIGRAGRNTSRIGIFDYGYVVTKNENVSTFCERIVESATLETTSLLDHDITNIQEDLKDIAEAIKEDTFNDDLQLTNSQVKRLESSNLECCTYILDNLFSDNKPLTGRAYYELADNVRKEIKKKFAEIYTTHIRREKLNSAEKTVLSTAIPIMLWRIQGKSFKEIVSLRHAYLTEKDTQRGISAQRKRGEITDSVASEKIKQIKIKRTYKAFSLPNASANGSILFPNISLADFDYDKLVYDTYDYLDKVVSFSLADPLAAAFQIYYNKTNDERALAMKNYIRYGTNDETEIWLLRYGFGFEDIEWLKEFIESIDQTKIVFKEEIEKFDIERKRLIERYI